jgi:hypothetical protein
MKKTNIFKNGFISYYLGILFLFGLSSIGVAQSQGEMSFGVKAGIASGTFSTSNTVTIGSPETGVQTGIFGNYNITDFLGATLEVLYSNTGAADVDPQYFYTVENAAINQSSNGSRIVNTNVVSQQLSIPILVSYHLNGAGNLGGIVPKVYAGGDIGFNLKSSALNTFQIYDNNNDVYYRNNYESMGERVKGIDFGAIVGTSIGIESDLLTYSLDARYRMGLSDINETKSSFVDGSVKRNVFSIMFGVAYKL